MTHYMADVVEDDHAPFHISAIRQEELLDSDLQIGHNLTFFYNLHPAGFGDQPVCAALAWWDGVYDCIRVVLRAPREVNVMPCLPPLMHAVRYLDSGEVTGINLAQQTRRIDFRSLDGLSVEYTFFGQRQGTSQSLPGLNNRMVAYPVPRHLLCELFDGLTF
ncbi:hypothetical protein CYMTET_46529 [Cymbomonas tetramitiformis]|uniref:Uncharacterized protein n=1 Tax=Cymbomonas tetramitiformis TaxID=36881 RepID=A0AAE0BW40_9CHLO|nr:hypothetical protein CYMTET_46529 [Cymbomonas tetramitiformis]